jgi:WD40 repeat protein
VYDIQYIDQCSIVSCSQDGTIKIWDTRSSACTSSISLNGDVSSWISCFDIDSSKQFLVCGHSERFLSIWHLSTKQIVSILPTPGIPQSVCYLDTKVCYTLNQNYQ